MKLRNLSPNEALELVAEIRAMAELPPGPNGVALNRAREIRFQLAGQTWAREALVDKADDAYRELEILLSHRRWKAQAPDLDGLRKTIKSACDRLRAYVPVVSSERAV